jgi:hypothetical protein
MLRALLTAATIAVCVLATPALAQTQANTPAAAQNADDASTARAEYRHYGRHHHHHWYWYRHHHRHRYHHYHHHYWYHMRYHHHHHGHHHRY